jgi:hypothetical protein
MKQLISQFLSGGILMAFLAIGYFFFRFWRKTRDGLFGVFAAAFWVLALERVLLLATVAPAADAGAHELRPYVYWVRFFAFMLIITGFYLKNRRAEQP